MSVSKLTKIAFDSEVLASDKPVLVDFFATWCMPCRMLSPTVDEIAEEHPEFKVFKIDVDEEPELAARYEVARIPTLAVFKNGALFEKSEGIRPKELIISLLEG